MNGKQYFERRPEYEGEPDLPVWPSFVEKLLLAIIDAHPQDGRSAKKRAEDQDHQNRLATALDALFHIKIPEGNSELYLLHGAVAAADREKPKSSAAEFEKSFLDLPQAEQTKAPSKRKARKEIQHTIVGQSRASREQRLEKFERMHRRYLEDFSLFRDHPEEQDMYRDLQTVARILKRWSAGCRVDPEALGMASPWGRN